MLEGNFFRKCRMESALTYRSPVSEIQDKEELKDAQRTGVKVRGSSEGEPDGIKQKTLLSKISLPKIEIEKKIERIIHWAWKSVSFDKLPEWMQDNEFLCRHYRPPMYSFRGCVKSMFRLHTETWNIWTHLLGFVFFLILCMGVYIFGDYITFLFEDVQIHDLPWDEQVMLFFFFFGAMACLCCSFMFHLFSNHSQKVFQLFIRLDYSGIAFLITGSSIPAYYYAFYCTALAKYAHILVLVILCISCISVSLWSKFSTPKYRPLRFAVFVLFGLYGIVPGVHIALREGVTGHNAYPLRGLCIMASLYLTGAGLYVLRIPERFFPGKFDIWASSHQIFHICVVSAALVHYDTLLNMVKYRLNVGGCMDSLPLDMLSI